MQMCLGCPFRIHEMLGILKYINKAHRSVEVCIYNSWRFAGHSKWQNIRHIKAEKDGKRAATFTKLRRLMEVAVKDGKNADPSTNIQLSHAIDQAKKANMPVATINDILKTVKEQMNASTSNEHRPVEILGPGGSAFIVCISSGQFYQGKVNVNIILKKSKGVFSVGRILHLFEHKGIIQTNFPPTSSLEDAVNVAIKLDIEDVIEVKDNDEDCLQFVCAPELLNKMKTQLEDQKYTVYSAEVNYKPVMQVTLKDSDLVNVNELYMKFQSVPEIVDIFDNLAWPEDKYNTLNKIY